MRTKTCCNDASAQSPTLSPDLVTLVTYVTPQVQQCNQFKQPV
jgi:hypothetical protein